MPQAKTADHYDALKVRHLAMKLFQRSGATPATAAAIADRLVAADIAGRSAEGVARIPGMVERLRSEATGPATALRIAAPTRGKPLAIRLDRSLVTAIQKEFDRTGVQVTLFNLRIRDAA